MNKEIQEYLEDKGFVRMDFTSVGLITLTSRWKDKHLLHGREIKQLMLCHYTNEGISYYTLTDYDTSNTEDSEHVIFKGDLQNLENLKTILRLTGYGDI